jgi:hypothetical protein
MTARNGIVQPKKCVRGVLSSHPALSAALATRSLSTCVRVRAAVQEAEVLAAAADVAPMTQAVQEPAIIDLPTSDESEEMLRIRHSVST